MAKIENDSADSRPPRLVKCPHCGRLVPREVGPGGGERPGTGTRRRAGGGGENVFPCPSCGLEIKERHLA